MRCSSDPDENESRGNDAAASLALLSQLSLDDVDLAAARVRVADALICMALGAAERSTSAAMEVAKRWSAPGGCTVAGRREGVAAPWAAFVNATAAHCLEFDDAHAATSVQAGAAIVPTALALAESLKAPDAPFFEAVVAGYEVALTLGTWVAPSHKAMGFHPSSTLTTAGAAAAACRLLGLSVRQTTEALRISTSFASGLLEFTRSPCDVNHVHPARAALTGILSADLARQGLTGPENAFEGRWGLQAAMSDGTPRPISTRPAHERRLFLDVASKPYPACRITHSAIDAALSLRPQLRPHEPPSVIDVAVSRQCRDQADRRFPGTLRERQFSVQFCVALALARGHPTLELFRSGSDLRTAQYASLVRLRVASDQSWPERAAQVAVTYADGETLAEKIDVPSGESPPADHWEDACRALSHRLPDAAREGFVKTVVPALTLPTSSALRGVAGWLSSRPLEP